MEGILLLARQPSEIFFFFFFWYFLGLIRPIEQLTFILKFNCFPSLLPVHVCPWEGFFDVPMFQSYLPFRDNKFSPRPKGKENINSNMDKDTHININIPDIFRFIKDSFSGTLIAFFSCKIFTVNEIIHLHKKKI